jgi:muramidase (phage lysozyme)
MDDDQAGILLLLVAVAAAVYFLGSGAGSSTSDDSGDESDDDVAGSALLGSAEGDLMGILDNGTIAAPSGGNVEAFLAAIGQSEVGAALIGETDSGYNVLYGATPSNPRTFSDYSTHPNVWTPLNNGTGLGSTAAGLYQINHPTWLDLCKQTGLSDFSPATQDAMAIQLITNKGALADINAGNFASAAVKLRPVWRSLPGATGGGNQPNNSMSQWIAWFQAAGGVLA